MLSINIFVSFQLYEYFLIMLKVWVTLSFFQKTVYLLLQSSKIGSSFLEDRFASLATIAQSELIISGAHQLLYRPVVGKKQPVCQISGPQTYGVYCIYTHRALF